MGAKDSKQSCISYEDAVKRGKWSSTRARIENIQNCRSIQKAWFPKRQKKEQIKKKANKIWEFPV